MIYLLRDSKAQDARISGGKASSLARLIAAGFSVPDGFVIVAEGSPEIARQVSTLDPQNDARFAVRSSGFAEDSESASFAGQFETFLGVTAAEVEPAVSKCFASFSNKRSGAYRENRVPGASGGAVLVQRLIDADAAGIAFTIDPVTGATDGVSIESNFGLGESVVSGRVTPDRFVVLKSTGKIAERQISEKKLRSVLTATGSILESMPSSLASSASLSDAQVLEVAELATRVESLYERPVDIEWAYRGEQLHLLQARPVTVAGAGAQSPPPRDWVPELNTVIDSRFPLYSSGNVSEILPGCVTPLSYSIFSRGVEKAFRQVAESLGSMPDIGPKPIVVGFFFYRVYLNVSYFMTAADNSPGATRDTVYEDLIGPPETRHPAWQWSDALPWNALRGIRIISRYLAALGRVDKDIAACRSKYDQLREEMAQRAPSQWSSEELAGWISAGDESLEPGILHIRVSQFATSSFSTLKDQTRAWLGDSNGVIASKLVTGIGTLASAGPSAALFEMAQEVLKDASLKSMFAQEEDDGRLVEKLRSTALSKKLDDFISNYGHRGFREVEFQNPCWRENPAAVISHVRKYLEPGTTSPKEIAARQTSLADQVRLETIAKVAGSKQKRLASSVDNARKFIAAREETKNLLLLYLDLVRRVLSAAQSRLSGVLESPDDIYMLRYEELASALRGQLDKDAVRQIVKRRRAEMDWAARVYVPKVQQGIARFLEAPEGAMPGSQLTGVSVSPGHVEGVARVVLDPSSATILQGEILVAPVTDVAWTPLFLRAAGLVVEVGGPLSHGSIVAREFGIPAVTGVSGAVKRIRTGDRLLVDGDRGTIVILEESARENG